MHADDPIRCIGLVAAFAVMSCGTESPSPANPSPSAGGAVTTAAGGMTSGTGGTAPPSAGASTGGMNFVQAPTDPATPPDTCAAAAYRSELLPSSLLWLVDRSGSMNCNLPPITESATCEMQPETADSTQPTKWSTLVGAMSSAVGDLSAVPNTSVGVTFFSNDNRCGVQSSPNVPLAPLTPSHVAALTAAFANVTPGGGTPIAGALILGYKHLHQQAMAPGNRFVVLVTDGSDSCLDRYAEQGVTGDVVARLIDTEIPKAISVNIRTFVIGAPGSESNRGLLSKIAFTGGTAVNPDCDHESTDPEPGAECHFDMTATTNFAADLARALEQITGRTAEQCEFDVPAPDDDVEVDPTKVNVDYFENGDRMDASRHVELLRDDTLPCDEGAEGWQYLEGNTRIRICGSVCERVRADPGPEVVVSLGCEQRIAGPR